MVPALPQELHALILENAAPFVYQRVHYQERQATLRACCLVSKLFLSLARPLLWQVVRCYTLPEVERFQDETACERGGYTRYTRMITSEILGDGDWDDGHGDDEDERIEVEADDVLQACRCFSELRRISVYSFSYEDPFDRSLLAQCAPKLQRLLLSSSFLQLSSPHFADLRKLSLPLQYSMTNEESWRALLTPRALPSLRVLLVEESTVGFRWPPISVDLVRQLEALQLNAASRAACDGRNVPITYTSAGTASLLASHCHKFFSIDPRMRLLHFAFADTARDIDNIASTASSSPSLCTLFLPDNLSPDNPSSRYPRDADARRARDALLALCAQHNIEIRWCPEEDSDPEETEPFILRQFVLFARERTRDGLAQ